MFKNFQSILLASFIALLVFSLLIFTLLATPRIKSAAVAEISIELFKQIALVEDEFTSLLYSKAELQAKALDLARLAQNRITVIDRQGQVLADSATKQQRLSLLENHGKRPEILQARKSGQGQSLRFSKTTNQDYIYTAIALKDQQQQVIGYLRLSVPSRHATNLVLKIHKSMAIALGLAILISVVASFFLTRGLKKSFKRLSSETAELRALEKYRAEFVANVSHELKTPLTAIRGYVETLLNGALDDQVHNRDFVEKIDKHAIRLSRQIDDLLEISKLESKRDVGQFVHLDLIVVIRHAMETLAQKAYAKKIKLELQTELADCFIKGLEDHVYRAVLNLLDNAINYTNQAGIVKVVCYQENKATIIDVIDNGLGIEPQHVTRIYERFYRVDKARSRELGGTGLGLAIVKHVMNIHQGRVLVESKPGQGSKFTLVFPA